MNNSETMSSLTLDQIGVVRTPFDEKFGIPRQPNLVAAKGRLEFVAPYNDPAAVVGLEQASHVWVLWWFHASPARQGEHWQANVRPPRLGGNRKLGVFATRSGFRPNRIAMSVCQLLDIEADGSLLLAGVDMLDGTPVVDVKPYLPYADSLDQARLEWASDAPTSLSVRWSADVDKHSLSDEQVQLMESVLAQDPRPAYHAAEREYGVSLAGFNIRFVVKAQQLVITHVQG